MTITTIWVAFVIMALFYLKKKKSNREEED